MTNDDSGELIPSRTIHLSELLPFISREQLRDEVRRAGSTPDRNR